MSDVVCIPVNTPSRSYEVVVGIGLLDSLGERVRQVLPRCPHAHIITDTHVGPLYLKPAQRALEQAGFEVTWDNFEAGEASKTPATLARLLEGMALAGCDRDTCVVALGGGVAGDMAGLSAALYMRGCPVVQVPTSLLAMVDSSVGGKTAVDLPQGKNLMGAFWQPWLVVADIACLTTVPPELLVDSVGEVIKHGILADPDLFEDVASSPITAQPLDLERLARIVMRNVEIKRDVVAADEKERGLRQTLNLGHTLGHAIEAASDFALGHGSSVAAGLCCVARASAARGWCTGELASQIEACVASYGLPTSTDAPLPRLLELSFADKKRHGELVNVVIPEALGQVAVHPMDLDDYARFFQAGLEGAPSTGIPTPSSPDPTHPVS